VIGMENTVKKVTKRDYFAGVRAIVEASTAANKDELVAFIDREVELLNKRNASRTGKPTKKQTENEALVEHIYDVLVDLKEAATINAIQDADEMLSDLSGQKVSALLKKLVDAGRVVKSYEKKKAYYLAVVEG
jgi:DNA-binding transcriptional regulator GbsR (MarR family)